jgi:hypothetical protein
MTAVERAILDDQSACARMLSAAAVARELGAPSPSIRIPLGRIQHKISIGIPLLHMESVAIPTGWAVEMLGVIAGDGLAVSIKSGRLDATRALEEALVSHPEHVAELAEHAGVDDRELAIVAAAGVRPLLRNIARRLGPAFDLVAPGVAWTRGYCPVCGAWPSFVLGIDGNETTAVCGRCGTTWPVDATRCGFCADGRTKAGHTITHVGVRWRHDYCRSCTRFVLSPADIGSLEQSDLSERHRQLDVLTIAAGATSELLLGTVRARPHPPAYRLELAEDDTEWDD